MSTLPPPFDRSEDADERYRRASEHDPSRPSEATRRAVLDHAARLAAERTRRAARRRRLMALLVPRWRPAIVGTLAVAVLAGVVIAPQFLAPTRPPESQRALAVSRSQAANAPATAPAAAPRAPSESQRASEALPAPAPAPAVNAPATAPPAARPARPSVARERARVAASANHSDALTTRQLEQQADAGAARAVPLEEPVVVAGARSLAQATTATSRGAAVAVPVPASPPAQVDPDALRQAAAAGDLTALRAQLASGGDIDARDAQGRTALMLATVGGQADAVAVLLAHGADPSAADAHGPTPLRAAVAADERAIIAMLRRYGAR